LSFHSKNIRSEISSGKDPLAHIPFDVLLVSFVVSLDVMIVEGMGGRGESD
jgi:hypothetical protein